MNVEISKCIKCKDKNKLPMRQFVRRNLILFVFLGVIWIFTVYPWPFLYAMGLGFDLDMSVLQPILITSLVLVIPFLFMLRAWQKKPPR